MAGINFHPAPGNINKLPPDWLNIRGVGDLVDTMGFAVPNRDMVPAVSVSRTMGIGEILATQGFTVPDRSMNPVADFVTGNVKPLGTQGGVGGCGCGCSGGCGGSLNGIGVGDISTDFSAITADFTAGNYGAILSAPIMGIPYALPLLLGSVFVLPMLFGGSSGGRRRR